jgi:hypothetical protein
MVKVRLKDVAPTDVRSSPGSWLRQGRDYVVLAIECSGRQQSEYRLAAEIENTPALFDTRLFEIVDGSLPWNWVATVNGDGLEFQPATWAVAGFWERFFDGDVEAKRSYLEERQKIGE